MHYACLKGHLDIVKFIQAKDKINFQRFIQMKTNTNASCLHIAVQYDNIELVEYILHQINNDILKILINEQTNSFETPLHIAGIYVELKF